MGRAPKYCPLWGLQMDPVQMNIDYTTSMHDISINRQLLQNVEGLKGSQLCPPWGLQMDQGKLSPRQLGPGAKSYYHQTWPIHFLFLFLIADPFPQLKKHYSPFASFPIFENVKQKRLEEDLMPSCGEGGNSAKKRRKERREQEGRQVGRVQTAGTHQHPENR